MKLSIIIPCYNVEKYVEKCIKSIKGFDFKYEIIAIDDGSTDNTLNILKKIKDEHLFIYSTKNNGLSDCRNFGLNKARGKFIYFLDSDDYIEPKILKKMVEINKDLVIAGVKTVKNSKLVDQYMPKSKLNLYTEPFWVWNKLFRHSIIKENNLRFKSKIKYEDIYFCVEYYQLISSIGIVQETLINYIMHSTSISAQYTNQKEYLKAIEFLEDYINYEEKTLIYHKYAITNLMKFPEEKIKNRIKDTKKILKMKNINYRKYNNEITNKQKVLLYFLYKNNILLYLILFLKKIK